MGGSTPAPQTPPQPPVDPMLAEQQTQALAAKRRRQERQRQGIDSFRIDPGLSPASTDAGLRIPAY
jgi:hypothetical protein